MNSHIVYTSTTHCKVPVTSGYPYAQVVRNWCHKRLSEWEWNPRLRKSIKVKEYYRYDPRLGAIRIPINFLDELIAELKVHGCLVELVSTDIVPPRLAEIPINPKWTDRPHQVGAINYLVTDPSPMRGLQLQTGCLTGDTIVNIGNRNQQCTFSLEEAYKFFGNRKHSELYTKSLTDKYIEHNNVLEVVFSGYKPVYKLTLENGNYIKGTADHGIMTLESFVPLIDCLGKEVTCVAHSDCNYCSLIKAVSIDYIGKEATYDICCQAPYHNFVANGIIVHNSGKTYCAVKSMALLGQTSLIIASGLIDQWYDAILEQTLVDRDDLFIVKGNATVNMLIETDIQPKIILCSLETIRPYILRINNYEHVKMDFPRLLHKLGVGVKIIDEAHLNFHACTMIDLYSNVQNNIYMTATFASSNKAVKKIFDTVYPIPMRYGMENYNKYVDIIFYGYHGEVVERQVMRARGYSHPRYEGQLVARSHKFERHMNEVLIPIINQNFINVRLEGQKLVIFFGTIEMINKVHAYLEIVYPKLKIRTYISGSPDSYLEDVDIILSTHKSAGTGTDIKNLRTVINTVSVKAVDTLVRQVLGRLRELNGTYPVMVDIFDLNLPVHRRHYFERSTVYKELGRSYSEYTIN